MGTMARSHRFAVSSFALWLFALAPLGCAANAPRPVTAAAPAPALQWEPWSPDTFERAQSEGRYVLVSVQAIWCHWCHVMNEETFGDPHVRQLLGDHFVAIAVDSDARPDLAERFRDYAWPATVLLSPDAEVIVALRGYRPPDVFAALLREVAAGERPAAPPPEAPAVETDLETLRAKARDVLDGLYDERGAGWGVRQKYPYAAPVEQAFFRAEALGETRWKGRALATLAGYAQLVDPVDGGVYQYSLRSRWDRPHFERIAAVQGGALGVFAEAYRLTGEARWRESAERVFGYIRGTLRAPGGAYFASQDADLDHQTTGAEYFALGAGERAALGAPRVDPHVYVDLNGRILVGLVAAARAGIDGALEEALASAERIEAVRDADGLFAHEVGVSGGLRYLRDQAWMLRAELLLHEATGDGRWLQAAQRTGDALASLARPAREGGGLYAHTPDPAARGVFAERRVPLEDNGVAARGLIHLGRLTHEDRWTELARSALRSQSPASIEEAGRRAGDYLLAFEELLGPYVLLSVVGPDDEATGALQRASFALPLPQRLVSVHRPGEGRYPFPGRPAVFLCNEAACSMPVSDAARLPEQAAQILAER